MSKKKHHNHMNCNCAQKRSTTITLPLDEYEKLICISERADIVARIIRNEKYPDTKMLLSILGFDYEYGKVGADA